MQRIGLSAWTGVVAAAFLILAPWILGGLVDQYGLTAAQAGQVLAANLAGTIVGPLLALATARRTSVQSWAGIAFGAIAVCQGAMLFAHSFAVLVILQSAAGIGAGFGLAAANVFAASTPRPERTFGWLLVGQMLFGAAWFFSTWLFPNVFARGVDLVFGVMAGMAAASLLLLRAYPSGEQTALLANGRRLRWSLPATLLCASLLAHYIANTAVWAYFERIGIVAGFDERHVGLALGLSMVAGIVGASLTGSVGQRLGAVGSLIAGLIAIAGATMLLLGLHRYSTYVVAACVTVGALCFAVPFYFALFAGFDRGGRWVLLGNVVVSLGLALGPGVGSLLVGAARYDLLLWFAIVLFGVALLLALAAARFGKLQGSWAPRSGDAAPTLH